MKMEIDKDMDMDMYMDMYTYMYMYKYMYMNMYVYIYGGADTRQGPPLLTTNAPDNECDTGVRGNATCQCQTPESRRVQTMKLASV